MNYKTFGFIYAIEATDARKVKFGFSNKPEERLKQLQTGCPVKLTLIAVVDWRGHMEKLIHKFLRPVHSHGEWFNESPQVSLVLEFMKTRTERSAAEYFSPGYRRSLDQRALEAGAAQFRQDKRERRI